MQGCLELARYRPVLLGDKEVDVISVRIKNKVYGFVRADLRCVSVWLNRETHANRFEHRE